MISEESIMCEIPAVIIKLNNLKYYAHIYVKTLYFILYYFTYFLNAIRFVLWLLITYLYIPSYSKNLFILKLNAIKIK